MPGISNWVLFRALQPGYVERCERISELIYQGRGQESIRISAILQPIRVGLCGIGRATHRHNA